VHKACSSGPVAAEPAEQTVFVHCQTTNNRAVQKRGSQPLRSSRPSIWCLAGGLKARVADEPKNEQRQKQGASRGLDSTGSVNVFTGPCSVSFLFLHLFWYLFFFFGAFFVLRCNRAIDSSIALDSAVRDQASLIHRASSLPTFKYLSQRRGNAPYIAARFSISTRNPMQSILYHTHTVCTCQVPVCKYMLLQWPCKEKKRSEVV
jgi:hypothetical protein